MPLAGGQFGGMPGLSGASGMAAEDAQMAEEAPLAAQPEELPLADAEGVVADPEMSGFPMMGTGAGSPREEQERLRQAWMNEDSEIWGRPANLVPPVIGSRPERQGRDRRSA
jgi:hypothetical protein